MKPIYKYAFILKLKHKKNINQYNILNIYFKKYIILFIEQK
jgi:hypothetical protein